MLSAVASAHLKSEAIARIRALRVTVPPPQPGSGWSDQPEAWYRLVSQICAVGSSRSWETLQSVPARERLSIARIRSAGDSSPAYVHNVLSELKVRYCSLRSAGSAKARAIAQNAHSPFIADTTGNVCLLNEIIAAVGEPDAQGLLNHQQARVARKLLIRNVRFFGPKSASDFLTGLGLVDTLLAFDVRLLNLLIDQWGYDPNWRACVHRLADYENLERTVTDMFCLPLQVKPAELDRLLFYGYASLKGSGRD
jgi:hypothetical protein